MDMKYVIVEGTINAFKEKGLKFTMDDIAQILSISKKTIYNSFKSKEALLLFMVDYVFSSIKDSESEIMNNKELSTIEKLKAIMSVLPDTYKEIDLNQMYILKEKYPKVYYEVEKRLETGWENTIKLLEMGIQEGVVRPITIPLFKLMLESVLEQFFQKDILVKNNITYNKALEDVVDILINGIAV